MHAPTTNTLEVPGATLYYEVRGGGPALVMIPGGTGDAGPFDATADELAKKYLVVTYDRRGYSRSSLSAPPDDGHRLAIDGDDVVRLLDELAQPTAYVFGSSSGAIVGLDLIARQPERVLKLVAHEAPLLALLPDAGEQLRFIDDIYDTYQKSGAELAIQKFSAGIGLRPPPRPPPGADVPPKLVEMLARMRPNFVFWLEHELRQYPRVALDLGALKRLSSRLVLAVGRDSQGKLPYRPNLVLAELLGIQAVEFPGDHIGYAAQATEFAARLDWALCST